METRRNWFTYIYLTIFGICLCFSLFSGILSIGVSTKYTFLWYGGILLVMGGLWLVLNTLAILASHYNLYRFSPKNSKKLTAVEAILITIVVISAVVVRLWIIRNLPVQPESDFQTYYKIAELLADGTLLRDGAGYCDYISQFPHVIGYPYILSKIFIVFGPSVKAGLYLNLTASVLSIIFVNRIGRLIYGRAGGFFAMLLVAFWPSQILYINQMASEPVFMCLTLLCIWIIAYLFKIPPSVKATKILILYVILGTLLAMAGAVRPVAIILLVAMIICTITYKAKASDMSRAGLIKSLISRGWIGAVVIIVSYLVCSLIISGATARTIDRELPGSTVSFGYNLMVGLNLESKGTWNEEDSKFLNDRFMETGSAQEAHKASRNEAVKRLTKDPLGIANLVFQKYTLLWWNDDYGAYWNLLFMEKQGNLTDYKRDLINDITVWNNVYYIICVYLSLVSGIFLWFRKNVRTEHVLILYFVGTALLHMILESQGRYHYNILPVFALLAVSGLTEIFRYYQNHLAHNQSQNTDVLAGKEQETKHKIPSEKDRNINNTSNNSFDMLEAIRKGHVTVTVTEAYLEDKDNKTKKT